MNKFFSKIGQAVTGRKGIGNTMTVAIIIAVIMLNILAYTVTSAFGLYLYDKSEDPYTISGNTDEIFASAIDLGKKVTITFCYAEDRLENHDTGKFVLDTARQFEERYPDFIDLKFINLLTKMDEDGNIVDFRRYSNVVCSKVIDDVTGKKCNTSMRFVDVDENNPVCTKCGSAVDLKDDVAYNFAQSSVIFETGSGSSYNYRVLTDRYTSAGFVDFYTLDSQSNIVAYNGEEVMAAMISWVLNDNHKTVYLTQNHGETADIALSNLLTCAGYFVDVINLRRDEIPVDAGMIIISNPTADFECAVEGATVRGEIEKLDAYLSGGGRVYVAFDPYVKNLPNLEKLLRDWGIEISGRAEDGYFVREIVRENSMAITPDGYTFIATYAESETANEIYGKLQAYGTDKVLMSNVAKLNLVTNNERGASVDRILVAGPTASTHAGKDMTDNAGNYTVAAASTKTVGDKEAALFVLPTAYITSTDAFISDSYSNKDFLFSTFEVLFGANPAPYGCSQILYDTQILENLTMGNAKIYTALILAIPAILAIVGTVILVKRKNR